ncbi:hypothetical protein KYG_11909 [Acidovorax sp. NO-1]|uniref:I78 family peptidase inhibitor n=1 Tax=Acidovorax sp. NO-1 TaxID=512030 RepID=UPI00023FD268|nr:I78 family peptidase inhibitor [Acidovorax sp. NO-1]EHL22559.1 hypothetical protein KYG_11909 [Acidovorax sp. NO-1]
MNRPTAWTLACSLALGAALAGCASPGPAPAPPGSPSATAPAPAPATACNAQPAQFAVGQNSTASVMESARVRSGSQMARIVRPGQMVTKEFNAQRLNLQVDANGRILAVTCG